MATDRRRQPAPSPDHDLLVRIDEQVKYLTATVKEHSNKTEAKIDKLAEEKADRAEIQEIKKLLEDKLPAGTFESTFQNITSKTEDHETRMRYMEKVVFRGIGAALMAQALFNAWVAWMTLAMGN
jgi:hypothetical protein